MCIYNLPVCTCSSLWSSTRCPVHPYGWVTTTPYISYNAGRCQGRHCAHSSQCNNEV